MNLKGFFTKKNLACIDWLLLAIVTVLVMLGILCIVNATSSVFTGDEKTLEDYISKMNFEEPLQQLLFFGMGLVLIFAVLLIDYNNLRDFAELIYWLCVLLLVLVLFFGETNRGTTGWFMIGSFGFQPSEPAKLGIIIAFAKLLAGRMESGDGIHEFRDILPVIWRFAIPFTLVIMQNEMGTAIVYCVIFFGMLFMAKTPFKMLLIILACFVALAAIAWWVIGMIPEMQWRRNRILTFFDPSLDPEGAGYNVKQSLIAIGSGLMMGKGFFAQGAMSQLDYLPEKHTDFIFATTIEAIGFVGGLVLIGLYALLLTRMVQLANHAKDAFGSMLIMGVVFMFLFHIFENVGMCMGIMPVTGIPLPFFSCGGSNMIISMLSVGLVVSVNMRRVRLGSSR